MAKISLIIADDDELYISQLVRYLGVHYCDKFNVKTFKNKDSLYSYMLESTNTMKIYLVAEKFISDEILNYKNLIVLSDNQEAEYVQSNKTICKYQNINNLVSCLINYLSENSTKLIVGNGSKDTKVITVYSPIGGSGKTAISSAIAIRYARDGKNVLFISFERIPINAFNSENRIEYALSSLFMSMKGNMLNWQLKIDGLKSIDYKTKVHFFTSFNNPLELDELEESDIEKFIEGIKNLKQYDYIILDTESSLTKKQLKIFELSDQVIITCRKDTDSINKLSSFMRKISKIDELNNISTTDKFNFILNMSSNNLITEFNKNQIDIKYNIPMVCGENMRDIAITLSECVEVGIK